MPRFVSALTAASFVLGSVLACSSSSDETHGGSACGTNCGSSGGASSSGGGGDGGSAACTVSLARGQNACVPGTAKQNAEITLAVRVGDCLGCGASLEGCKVTVNGTTVTLSLTQRQCPVPGGVCPATCAVAETTCKVPPLAVGTYQVVLEGEPESTGLPPRELAVTDQASATSCELFPPGTPPPPLTTDGMSTTCTIDDDCTLVRTGDPCAPCSCPNAAIAKEDRPYYEYVARPLTAACARPNDAPSCAGCPPVAATCVNGTCQL